MLSRVDARTPPPLDDRTADEQPAPDLAAPVPLRPGGSPVPSVPPAVAWSVTALPKIVATKRATPVEWDDVVDASPCATFFHTREWAELWQTYSAGALTPAGQLVRFADGAVALLPGVEKALVGGPRVGRLGQPLRSVISAPSSTYGGWVSAWPLTADHHRALWRHVGRLNLDMTQNPYDPELAHAGLPWTRHDVTHVVDLRPGYEQVRRGWSRGHLSAVNKAARAGLRAVPATRPAQWEDYYRVYELSMRRWGTPNFVYRPEFFRSLSRSGSGKVRLWVVEHEGQVIAGMICLYQGTTVMYWHGAFDAALQHLRAAPLLHAEAMRHAADAGYHWYDFNPSGGNEGVMTFKERFGAERYPVQSVVQHTGVKKALVRLRAQVARPR
ncbi:MAG TPA: GNAT family N-acetyltransferase [Kineosporiaceae bacterium]